MQRNSIGTWLTEMQQSDWSVAVVETLIDKLQRIMFVKTIDTLKLLETLRFGSCFQTFLSCVKTFLGV